MILFSKQIYKKWRKPQNNTVRKGKEKLRKAKQRSLITPAKIQRQRENDNIRKSEERTKEAPEQAEIRRRKIAENMATLQSMETIEKAEIRWINNAKNMASQRPSSERIQITENQDEVPLISRYVETEEAKQKAFST
jgi:hypothetical protein